jgi:hypothetical protein
MTSVWGPPVWTFFHTMAEKIHEDKFAAMKPALVSYLKTICCNLPCPECSMHARAFLTRINFAHINDKTTFKNFLHMFHNTVNKRKKLPIFEKDNLANYANVNLLSAFNNFLVVYRTKGNMKLLVDSFQRSRILKGFKEWFIANASGFDL